MQEKRATEAGRNHVGVGEVCLLKKSTIVFIELGMIGGILIAGYTLPGDTSLLVFLIASSGCFLMGNLLLAAKVKGRKADQVPGRKAFWIRMLQVFIILGIIWLLRFLVFPKR
jgi:hypothetical protein